MHSHRWYITRLARYFEAHYRQYEDTAEFFPDPADNQWLFDITELEVRIELTCHETGVVTEERYEKGGARL